MQCLNYRLLGFRISESRSQLDIINAVVDKVIEVYSKIWVPICCVELNLRSVIPSLVSSLGLSDKIHIITFCIPHIEFCLVMSCFGWCFWNSSVSVMFCLIFWDFSPFSTSSGYGWKPRAHNFHFSPCHLPSCHLVCICFTVPQSIQLLWITS